MERSRATAALLLVLAAACGPARAPGGPEPGGAEPAPRAGGEGEVVLATTTTTQDSGLLDVLIPAFEQRTGYRVKTIIQGSGAVLALAARGEADVVLAHSPDAEKQWMAQGNGSERLLVMHNDFLVVGPGHDPAHVRGAPDAVSAFRAIAEARATFVSRGDQSGTHVREQALWRDAGITPRGQPWYVESGSGMGQTLIIADQRDAYALSDRGTWLAFRPRLRLAPLFEGGPGLLNIYHVMPVNAAKFPDLPINAAGGKAFADFLVGPEGQRLIGEFGREQYGQPLFVPDAGKPEDELVR